MVWRCIEEGGFVGQHAIIIVMDCFSEVSQDSTISYCIYYLCAILTNLKRAIRKKTCAKLTKRILLLHENARRHAADESQDLIDYFEWGVIGHPPYNSDHTSSDFHLFRHLEHQLGGKRFYNDEDVKEAARAGGRIL